jgi:hypothetical protein
MPTRAHGKDKGNNASTRTSNEDGKGTVTMKNQHGVQTPLKGQFYSLLR